MLKTMANNFYQFSQGQESNHQNDGSGAEVIKRERHYNSFICSLYTVSYSQHKVTISNGYLKFMPDKWPLILIKQL
jgi:hypothetical protein